MFDNISYTYDENGIRASKTVDGKTTYFYVKGSQLFEQINGRDCGLHFFYDRNGELTAFARYYEDDEPIQDLYYYVKNAQGDITDITDDWGNIIASYTYDPWGKVLSVTGSDTVIGNLNPFRYRGYYYDDETGLYYLQSRYYDPEVGRFINADAAHYIGITESVVSNNAFAYCENDPVNSFDPSGEKSYVNIPSFKSENWEYIINKSINLYEGSKIYKKLFTTIMVRDRYGRIRNVKVPLFLCKSADIYKKTGILFLNYFNSTQNNSKYRVTLGCMTVDNWNAYIVGKHKLALMKIKRKILKELNISSDKFDRAVEVAKDFYDVVSTCLELADKVPTRVAIASGVYKIIRKVIKYVKKYNDRQDNYIRNIISGRSNKDNILILLYREDYTYNTIYYQRGIYWVCETGWHLQDTVRMY